MNTEPNIPKLILGPSARDDQALNERLATMQALLDEENYIRNLAAQTPVPRLNPLPPQSFPDELGRKAAP